MIVSSNPKIAAIEQPYLDKGHHIAATFASFMATSFPGASPEQRDAMELAFFGGALIGFTRASRDAATIKAIGDELAAFASVQIAEAYLK